MFSLDHNDEEHSAFVPAAEPADLPIIDTIAQRPPARKTEGTWFERAWLLASTHIHGSVIKDSQAAFCESSKIALLHR